VNRYISGKEEILGKLSFIL